MTAGAIAFAVALTAGYGVFLLFTAVTLGWTGVGVSPALYRRGRFRRAKIREFLIQAGLERLRPIEFVGVEIVIFFVAGGLSFALYGGFVVPLAVGAAALLAPIGSARLRQRTRRELAREAWPRMLEELRLQVLSLGKSIPQALIDVGLRGPQEMRPAFVETQREWLISTDFSRALDVLKWQLADPTADAVCETLLIAYEVGGTDVGLRLRALVEDRTQDLQGRKDARAKQAGVRFARYFVLIVPVGMAMVGLLIGDGRQAYETPSGQAAVLIALGLMGCCWVWAGQLLRLPEEQRVFPEDRRG